MTGVKNQNGKTCRIPFIALSILLTLSIFYLVFKWSDNVSNSNKKNRIVYHVSPIIIDQGFISSLEDGKQEVTQRNAEQVATEGHTDDTKEKCYTTNADSVENYTNVNIVMDIVPKNNKSNCRNKNNWKFPGSAFIRENQASITKINGTNLYTGMYYKVGMKRFPEGWVSYTYALNDDRANYFEIDLSPENIPRYKKGGEYELENQWAFGESEIPGWFTFTNRKLPRGIARWSYEKRGSGYGLIISNKAEHLFRLSSEGDWRNDSLWLPKASNEDNYYQLKLNTLPQAVVTWSYEKYNDISHYLIAATKKADMNYYRLTQKWYNDSLFKFEPADVTLEARIYDVQYKKGNIFNDLKNKTNGNYETAKLMQRYYDPTKESPDDGFQLDETITKMNYFYLNFDFKPLKMVKNLNVRMNLPNSISCSEFSYEDLNLRGREYIIGVQKQDISFRGTIKAANITSISLYLQSVNNLKIPFTAKIKIMGTASTIKNGQIGKSSLPVQVLKDLMKIGKLKKAYIENDSEKSVVIELKGTMFATFPIANVVQCSSCKVENLVSHETSSTLF